MFEIESPPYEEALKNAGYKEKLVYTEEKEKGIEMLSGLIHLTVQMFRQMLQQSSCQSLISISKTPT